MQTIDQAAAVLASKHYEIEPGITQIFRVELPAIDASKPRPIGLLEVNQDTVASGIVPLYFAPNATAGIYFPSMILEITPEELRQIKSNELQLPPGWVIRDLIPRPQNGAQQ